MNSKTKRKKPVKKTYIIVPVCVLLTAVLILGTVLIFQKCSALKLVEKTEGGLKFAIPEDFERSYNYGADIEYSGDDIAFFADLFPYSDYELTYGATIKECTEAVIDANSLGNVTIRYDEVKKTAQFATWATDEEGVESYYNYIVILLSKNGVYVARYVCAGTDREIKKYSEDFSEMAGYLSVLNP